MIRVIAIDDEPLALLQLQNMVQSTPFFTLVAACSSAFEAMQVMEREDVDAMFVDINMPDLSGLDFVKTLTRAPLLVFTTAYSQYAIDGYKVNAIDYLLKPFGLPEFQRAAAKVKQQYELIQKAHDESSICGDILFIKVDYRVVKVNVNEIRYVESMGEYLRIYMTNGPVLMTLLSIKRIGEMLPKGRFVRIHRSYLVNMLHVVEIARLRFKMDADTYLPVGDMYKDDVQKYINDRSPSK